MGFLDFRIFHGLLERIFIELDHIVRGALRSDERTRGAVPFIIVAEFAQGRYIWELRISLFRIDAEDFQLCAIAFDEFCHISDFRAGEIDFALTESEELVSGAAIRNRVVFKFRRLCEELGCGVIRSLHAIRRTFQLSRVCLCICNEFLQAVPLRILLDHDDSRFCQVVADRDDGLVREGRAFHLRERGVGRQVDEADGLSVRLGFCKLRPADLAVSARFIFDDECLPDIFLRAVRQETRTGVRAGAGLVRHDDLDVLCWFPRSVACGFLVFVSAAGKKNACGKNCDTEQCQFLIHRFPPCIFRDAPSKSCKRIVRLSEGFIAPLFCCTFIRNILSFCFFVNNR